MATEVSMRVGDKVSRQPALNEETTFFRVKKVDPERNVFETDPNGPFERGWKGRISDHKPHHTHPGYWVPLTAGIKVRAAVNAMKEDKTKKDYAVTLNWHGEIIEAKVRAHSEAQAKVVAAVKWAEDTLKAFTRQHINAYMKNNQARVQVKLLPVS